METATLERTREHAKYLRKKFRGYYLKPGERTNQNHSILDPFVVITDDQYGKNLRDLQKYYNKIMAGGV